MSYTTGIPAWEEMTTAQQKAADYAWSHGELDAFILPHQQPLWALICAHVGLPTKCQLPDDYKEILGRTSTMKPLVVEVARRFGKSSLVLLAMMALCLRNKSHTYYFVAPNEGDARDILDDVYPPLIATCPPRLRPKRQNMTFQFRNGARIKIGGTFNGGEGLRGRAANGSAVDEAGSIVPHGPTSCLTYVVSSILLPQLSTTKGWQVLLTTPPSNMQHDYYDIVRAAEKDGRFIRMDVYQNTSFTPEEIEAMKEASLTTDPTGAAWDREYMCHARPDAKTLIIPENIYNYMKANNCIEWQRPEYFEHYDRYISFDHGTVDLNAILFGYWDFFNAKLVIEKELEMPGGPTTKQIATRIKTYRTDLWGTMSVEKALCDSISQQLRLDLNDEFKNDDLYFVAPIKTILLSDNSAREGMVNKLINGLGDGYIIIHPSCTRLIETLRTAQWKISLQGKREFGRLGDIGHADFLAALIYMWISVIRNKNPLQGKVQPSIYNHWITQKEQPQDPKSVLARTLNRPRQIGGILNRNPFFGRK